MSARALLYTLALTPKASPDAAAQKKLPGSDFKSRYRPLRIQIRVGECCSLFRVSAPRSSGERGSWKVWADVKSKPYDVSGTVPDSVKFEESIDGVVLEQEEFDSSVPWWEQFPKRWVIVVLCFSAFLLCNMDRVSSFSSLIVSLSISFIYLYIFVFLSWNTKVGVRSN